MPNQPGLQDHYKGSNPIEEEILNLVLRFSDLTQFKTEELDHSDAVPVEYMSSPPNLTAFFAFLLGVTGAKKVLEIGTFIGRTTMQFVDALGEGGRVTTIEIGDEFAGYSRTNFERHGYSDRIDLYVGTATDVMQNELKDEKFDFIFIDGGKESYLDVAKIAINQLTPRGIIVVDDIFLNGDVFNNPPTSDKGEGCRRVLDYFADYNGCKKVIIPLGNGQLFLFGFDT